MIPDLPYSAPDNVLPFPLVREACPWCCGRGKVPVPDGSALPALALCACCRGKGWITTERIGYETDR